MEHPVAFYDQIINGDLKLNLKEKFILKGEFRVLVNQLGKLMVKKKLEISDSISKHLDQSYNQLLKENNFHDHKVGKWRAYLISYIGESLIKDQVDDLMPEITDWATQTAEGSFKSNISIDALLQTNKVYRTVIWDFVKEIETAEVTLETFLRINRVIDTILDHTAYIFGVSYVKDHEQVLRLVHESGVELSTPVVKINKDIAVLPLVGDIDTYRARIMKERTIKSASELKITELYIDLSGVPIVDTMVANELFQVARALDLIGVKPTFTGIRPEIAQSIVNLGIDFKGIKTLGSLEQALHGKIKKAVWN